MSDETTLSAGDMRPFLEDFETARPWLVRVGFADPQAAHRNFLSIAETGVPLDLLASFGEELSRVLPGSADPDMALNNFERMLQTVRSKLSMMTFLLRKPNSLAILLQLFATSQYFSNLMISSPEYFDFLWEHGQTPLDPKLLKDEILGELKLVWDHEDLVLNLIRRHRHRELLRIGYRDIILGEPLDRITRSISDLADCLVEVALSVAYRRQSERHGEPRSSDGRLSRLVVLAMGKLGGRELNYSSDIDLMLVYDFDGRTDGKRSIENAEFFSQVIREMVRLLSANTPKGHAYRVDLRLRPHGHHAALCLSLKNTLAYYDQHGRTWERQALVKARPIAGSMRLGEDFLREIEPFVYRRYLTFVEINEIKAIKRRIEAKTIEAGVDATDLKTGAGGIRDIEFVTQFLQLVNGGVVGEVRERNTLAALKKLTTAGCINQTEHSALEMAYRFLRKAEHRLQFMFDLQTHRIPESAAELDKLAVRLGYLSGSENRPGEEFLADLRRITGQNRSILKHLMLDLFPDDPSAEGGYEPEADLILDPDPDPERIQRVLGRYRFADVAGAYKNLCLLAREEVPFLSSVRCRHFLASIAPQLLEAVNEAPDPDMALVNLEKVTASLGAKGVLWESFSFNPPFLKLYVQLCSWSQFLSEILITNPGMIDELLDTLIMNRVVTREDLKAELEDLLKGAREIDPILHSFKNDQLLRIGVNDILGKAELQQTTRELSDLAEVILGAVADLHWRRMTAEHGAPMLEREPNQVSWFAILGLGKLGGGELSYHSDLDIVLIYDGDGRTRPLPDDSGRLVAPTREPTNNHHFYSELAQRMVRTVSQLTPLGRLYSIDLRLRPTGRSGSLTLPLDKFADYYQEESSALWERLALTRARVVHGEADFSERLADTIRRSLVGRSWRAEILAETQDMRQRLESSRPANDIKRGPGGIVDVEFAVQLLQIRHGNVSPSILEPNVWRCLDRIEASGLWSREMVADFRDGYTFLRSVESRLRIVYNVARDDLPSDPAETAKLALRLGYDDEDAGAALARDIETWKARIRRRYLESIELERRR